MHETGEDMQPDGERRSGPNLPEYSVSEIAGAVKRALEDQFTYVRVRGEISAFKRHSSGHCYFTMKDADAALDAVIWRGTAQRMRLKPEDGMEVIATGRISSYPKSSRYQIVVERLELAGAGALLALLEQRRKAFAAEGLFDTDRKRALPFLPATIGVVTSPTGAVIRDIVHRLADRFPVRVLVWPVRVQGDTAAAEVAAAIAGFDALRPGGAVPRPDLLIVARGGGSIEDLWAFNEDAVVRAAAACTIPLISAVGHETDTTLIDFVADRRAPTPTAAAEMAVPVRAELIAQIADDGARLTRALTRLAADRRARLLAAARGLPRADALTALARQRLDGAGEGARSAFRHLVQARRLSLGEAARRLPRPGEILGRLRDRPASMAARLQPAIRARLAQARSAAASAAKLLEALSFRATLARGFALLRDADGAIVRAAGDVQPGAPYRAELTDGEAQLTGAGAPRMPAPARRRKPAAAQGDLF